MEARKLNAPLEEEPVELGEVGGAVLAPEVGLPAAEGLQHRENDVGLLRQRARAKSRVCGLLVRHRVPEGIARIAREAVTVSEERLQLGKPRGEVPRLSRPRKALRGVGEERPRRGARAFAGRPARRGD